MPLARAHDILTPPMTQKAAPSLPLVFFPGASGRVATLRPLSERLANRRPIVLCEYPGLGGAAARPGLSTLSDLQAHLLGTLPDRFDLVTMSMGGVLGLRIALEAPERIRKLVLLATSGGVDVQQLGGVDWRDTFRRMQPTAPSWFVDDHSDVTAELHRVTQPTLLVFGEDDLIAPPAVGKLLAGQLPAAQLEIIERATHDLELEFPDTIAALIERHLRS